MSVIEVSENVVPSESPRPARERRPVWKIVMHWIRRGHLYLGLLLFPWALLYGVTAFLFNHPTVFTDQQSTSFGPSAVAGTLLESAPSPAEQAAKVVEELNARKKPETPYRLVGPENARDTREFAFATVRTKDQQFSVLVDVVYGGGTIRGTPPRTAQPIEKAPFATESASGRPGRGGQPGGPARGPGGNRNIGSANSLKLDDPLHERVKAAVPTILERTGFPTGDVTVTSVPELAFQVEADGKVWNSTYNAQTGAVSGRPASAGSESELSVRRFLLRLHTAHGYPSSVGARWFWAVVVDAMAAVMVFWGLSGLLMWWQIKATRRLGFLLLLLSAAGATALAFGMHAALTQ
jgi:hypothetical protein